LGPCSPASFLFIPVRITFFSRRGARGDTKTLPRRPPLGFLRVLVFACIDRRPRPETWLRDPPRALGGFFLPACVFHSGFWSLLDADCLRLPPPDRFLKLGRALRVYDSGPANSFTPFSWLILGWSHAPPVRSTGWGGVPPQPFNVSFHHHRFAPVLMQPTGFGAPCVWFSNPFTTRFLCGPRCMGTGAYSRHSSFFKG